MNTPRLLLLLTVVALQCSICIGRARIPPATVVANEGQDVVLTDTTGVGSQWQFEGNDIAGETNGTLRLSSVKLSQAGYYSVVAYGGIVYTAALVVQTSPAHPGATDLSFRPEATEAGNTVFSLALASDGAAVISGYFGVIRLLADGKADPAFQPPALNTLVRRVLLQRDGRILLEAADTTITRLLPDGSADPEFRSAVSMSLLAVQNDNRVLGMGIPARSSGPVRRLLRLNSDGSLDPTFQSPDVLLQGVGFNALLDGALVQKDGAILISGVFDSVNGERRLLVARLLPNGALDHSFQADSFEGSPFLASDQGGLQLVGLQQDRRIVLLTPRGSTYKSQLVRLNPDGSLDLSLAWSGQRYDFVTAALQADDKVVLARNGTLFRFEVTGGLDPAFRVVLPPSEQLGPEGPSYSLPMITGMAVRDNGRIVVAGMFDKVNLETTINVAQLFSDTTDTPPVILEQPEAQLVLDGDLVALKVQSTSLAPPAYQWRRDGFELPAATNSVLLIPHAGAADTGRYDVLLKNRVGSTNSALAQVTVLTGDAAGFERQPQNRIGPEGDRILLDVSVLSRAQLSYQWQFEGHDLPGATNSSYLISPALLDQAGAYQAIVHGSFGAITSAVAHVTVTSRVPSPGTVDLGFFPGEGANGSVESVALLPDGHILVAGAFTEIGRTPRHLVAQLLPDGHIDETFVGPDPARAADWARVLMALPLPDGSVVLRVESKTSISCGGLCAYAPLFAAKLHKDGQIDSGFAPIGSFVAAMLVQPDGKIVIAHDAPVLRGVQRPGGITRLNPDGTADPEFQPLSVAAINAAGMLLPGSVPALALQPTGNIVLMGAFGDTNGLFTTDLRMTSQGALDPTFQVAAEPYRPDVAIRPPANLLAQPDGKLILSAFTDASSTGRQMIRLTGDGALDPTFHSGATVAGGAGTIEGLLLQPDGRILLWGDFTTVAGVPRLKLARLEADGRLDLSFNPVYQLDGLIQSVTRLEGGTLVLGGRFSQVNDTRRANIALLFPRQLVNPTLQAGHFTARFGTIQGRFYSLESSPSMASPIWAAIAMLPGDGSLKTISDTNALSTQQFYRLRVE